MEIFMSLKIFKAATILLSTITAFNGFAAEIVRSTDELSASQKSCYQNFKATQPENEKSIQANHAIIPGTEISKGLQPVIVAIGVGGVILGYKFAKHAGFYGEIIPLLFGSITTGGTAAAGMVGLAISVDQSIFSNEFRLNRFNTTLKNLELDASVGEGKFLTDFSERLLRQLVNDEEKLGIKNIYSIDVMKSALGEVILTDTESCLNKTSAELNMQIINKSIQAYHRIYSRIDVK